MPRRKTTQKQTVQRRANTRDKNSLDMRSIRVAAGISRTLLQSQLGSSFGGRRQLYPVLGYEKVLNFSHYLAAFLRTGVGKRIINAAPNATWRREPEVCEDNN